MADNTPTVTRNADGTLTMTWPNPDRLPRTVEAAPEVLQDMVAAHNALVAERDEARADAERAWELAASMLEDLDACEAQWGRDYLWTDFGLSSSIASHRAALAARESALDHRPHARPGAGR